VTAQTTRRLAWGIWTLSMMGVLGAFVWGAVGSDSWLSEWSSVAVNMVELVFVSVFATVGALIASRRPDNAIGWLLGATALCYSVGAVAIELGSRWPRYSDWLSNWIWFVGVVFGVTFVPLLFPNGHLPSRRWRPVAWLAGAGLGVFVVGSAFLPGVIPGTDNASVNPFGFGGTIGHTVFGAMRPVGTFLLLLAGLLSLASLVFRYRSSGRTQREQLRWLIFSGLVVGIGILVGVFVGTLVSDPRVATDIENAISSFTVMTIPIAIGIAILRRGLYDIDLVLNKTVVYGALAAFITGVYVAIVVGLGTLVGRGGQPNVALSILATGVIAVAFQPVRERVQRFANRLVYGKRATPYEVLSEFSDRLGGTYDTEDLLPRMARILAEGTGAIRTDVWLASGSELRPDASWPQDAPVLPRLPADPFPETFFPVRHQGELLGALSLEKRAGESPSATEQKLVEDLAGQAGLVLRNGRLTEELRQRLEDLQASRQRLVAAQDEERRKIERNIHDGAQQQLVALAIQLKLAEQLIDRDADKAKTLLGQLQGAAGSALEDLRDLARGIYPPLLADQGLAAALEAQARKAAVPVSVESDGMGRFSQDVEATVYFCTLEALNNVAKYAGATRATIRLANGEGYLRFEIQDDGVGFDPNATGYGTGLQGMADRLAAQGGELHVTSSPGSGTTIEGRVPIEAAA